MTRWYYSQDGKAEGPVDASFIVEGLRVGHFTLVDQVFQEGGSHWQTIQEVTELLEKSGREKTNQVGSSGSGSANLIWVILQRVSGKTDNPFRQNGPFSEQQVLEKIKTGEVKYSDYAWRPGFNKWARIGSLAEFDRRAPNEDHDLAHYPLPEIEKMTSADGRSPQEALNEVQALQRKKTSSFELKPDEPVSEDLLATKINIDLPASFGDFSEAATVVSMRPLDHAARAERSEQAFDSESATVVMARPSSHTFDPNEHEPTVVMSSNFADRTVVQELGVIEKSEVQTAESLATSAEVNFGSSGESIPNHVPQTDPAIVLEDFKSENLSRWNKKRIGLIAGGVATLAVGAFLFVGNNEPEVQQPIVKARPANPPPPVKSVPSQPTVVSSGHGADAPQGAMVDNSLPPAPPQNATNHEASSGAQQGAMPSPTIAPPVNNANKGVVVNSAPKTPPSVANSPVVTPTNQIASEMKLVNKSGKLSLLLPFDVGMGEKVNILVRARAGEVVDVPSVRRVLQVSRMSPQEVLALDVSKLKLPAGHYKFEADFRGNRKVFSSFVGNKVEFDSKLAKHLKAISNRQQNEKKVLFTSAKKLEELSRGLGEGFQKLKSDRKKWGVFYVSWKKQTESAVPSSLVTTSDANLSTFIYPDEVLAIRRGHKRLLEQARGLDAAVAQKREIASRGKLSIVKDFTKLREHVASLSTRYPAK